LQDEEAASFGGLFVLAYHLQNGNMKLRLELTFGQTPEGLIE
jgi:hypothetical protein